MDDQWNEQEDNEARLAELERIICADDPAARADALVEKAQLLHAEGESEYPAVIAHLEAAIELNETLDRPREQVFPNWFLGDVLSTQRKTEEAKACYHRAIAAARASAISHDAIPACLTSLATMARRECNDLLAIEYLKEAIEASADSIARMPVFSMYMQMQRSQVALNLFEEADKALDAAYEIASDNSVVRAMVDAQLEKVWIRLKQNRLDEVPELLELLEAGLEMAKHPFAQEFMDVLVLAYQTRTNPTVETIKGLDALREIGRERADGGMMGLVNIERARFFLAVENFAEARKVLRKLEVTAPQNLSRRFTLHEVHLLTAEAYEREGDWQNAAEYVSKAIETSKLVPIQREAEELMLRRAELQLQAGSFAFALAELESLPLDVWHPEEEAWIRHTFALARAYEALERHAESIEMANRLLCKLEPNGTAVAPEFDFPENLDAYWISAQLHELKCQALQGLGETATAASEAERAKYVYETTEDYESMARMNRVIKSATQSLITHEQKVVQQQEELGELPGGYWH